MKKSAGITKKNTVVIAVFLLFALIAFEVANFSFSNHALSDLLGDSRLIGLKFAMIFSIAFVLIDLVVFSDLLSPDCFLLFLAWFLAAVFNAYLVYWAVGLSITNHPEVIEITRGGIVAIALFAAFIFFLVRLALIATLSYVIHR